MGSLSFSWPSVAVLGLLVAGAVASAVLGQPMLAAALAGGAVGLLGPAPLRMGPGGQS